MARAAAYEVECANLHSRAMLPGQSPYIYMGGGSRKSRLVESGDVCRSSSSSKVKGGSLPNRASEIDGYMDRSVAAHAVCGER